MGDTVGRSHETVQWLGNRPPHASTGEHDRQSQHRDQGEDDEARFLDEVVALEFPPSVDLSVDVDQGRGGRVEGAKNRAFVSYWSAVAESSFLSGIGRESCVAIVRWYSEKRDRGAVIFSIARSSRSARSVRWCCVNVPKRVGCLLAARLAR